MLDGAARERALWAGVRPGRRVRRCLQRWRRRYETTHAPKMLDRATRFASSLPAPSRILDAGCGPGRDLARFIARGHDAYGVDLNADFVSKATKHAPTIMADLREVATHFEAESFDGIWAAASLVHLGEDETGNVLRQFAVLIRPIGKLYVCVKVRRRNGMAR